MKKIRKKRLTLILLLMLGISSASAFVLYALRQNISLFYTPTQVKNGEAPKQHSFRIGGMVQTGSVKHSEKNVEVNFVVSDLRTTMRVHYVGVLPDLFKEGQGIVALGKLAKDGHFEAAEVLAKHDENYMPPEVKAALKRQGAKT